jgi:hypothetical protein
MGVTQSDPEGWVGAPGVPEQAGSGVTVKNPRKAAMVWKWVEVLRATPGNRLGPTVNAPLGRLAMALALRTYVVPQGAPVRLTRYGSFLP